MKRLDKDISVFVYGSLRKGLGNHSLLSSCGPGVLCKTTKLYTMYSLGSFPAISQKESYPIIGEYYMVSEDILSRLDFLEGHPNFYNRQCINTTIGLAWAYFIHDGFLIKNAPLSHGDWKVHRCS